MQDFTTLSSRQTKNKILIADDADIGRGLLKALLRKQYDILEARNGLEVVEILKSNPGNISCILLDMLMPVMGGLKVLEFMKENDLLDRIPVIAVTAISDSEGKIACYEAGAIDIIEKPYDEKLLLHRVQHFVNLFNNFKSIRQKCAAESSGDADYYSAILDSLPQAVFILDASTKRIKYCNDKFTRLPGIPGSPVGQPLADFFPSSAVAAMHSSIDDLLVRHTQTPASIKDDASGQSFSVIFNALQDANGQISDIIGTMLNVTKTVNRIHELENSLRASTFR